MLPSRRDIPTWEFPTWTGLIGDVFKPLVPFWWAQALPEVQFKIFYTKRKVSHAKTSFARAEVIDPILSDVGIKVDLHRTFESLGENILAFRNDFLDAPVGDARKLMDLNLMGGQLPILLSYKNKFDDIGLGTKQIGAISEIPIEYLLGQHFTWLEIADLSMILNHGIVKESGIISNLITKQPQTLESSANLIVHELWKRDGCRLEHERMLGVARRIGIGSQVETLDKVGESLELTRERVRQIEKRFVPHLGQRVWPITAPMQFVYEYIKNNDSSDIFDDLVGLNLSDSAVNWDRDMFERLLEAYGHSDLVEELKGLGEPIELDFEFKKVIRKHRNGSGFFDLRTFVNESGEYEQPDAVFEYLPHVYKFAFRSGDVALAGDIKGTQAQNAVEKQFAVCSEISGEELVEGIDRVSRNRGYGNLPPTPIILDLLQQAGTIKQTRPGYFTGNAGEIDSPLKIFIVNAIKDSPGGVANQPELFRFAITEGFNTSSLVVYLTYDPMIRKFENGLIRLVGSNPSIGAIEEAKRSAKLQSEKGSLDHVVTLDGSINVTCVLGTSYLNTGVLSPSSALRGILNPDGYSINCCEESSFDGKINLSATLWYGFQPLFNHMRHEHSVVDGDVVSFVLSNGGLRISSW